MQLWESEGYSEYDSLCFTMTKEMKDEMEEVIKIALSRRGILIEKLKELIK
jgi:inosine/xanthosine triphosphate pyrophosphatase family protein